MKKFAYTVLAIIFSAAITIAQNEAQITFEEKTHDFGTFAEEMGKVTHEFIFTNTGTAPLILQKVTASCGCTTPVWTKEPIGPGKTGKIEVTYNATGRPGAFSKNVTVVSNAKNATESVLIKGEVTPKSKNPEAQFSHSLGNEILTDKREIKLASLKDNETKKEYFTVFNNNLSSVELVCNTHGSKLISAEQSVITVSPKESGQFVIIVNGNGVGELGPVQDYFTIETAEESSRENSKNRINVTTIVVENFDSMTQEEWNNAPVAELSTVLVSLDKNTKKGKIEVRNTGKSTLKIRKVTLDNALFVISGGKESLKPGTTASYNVSVKDEKAIAGKASGNITFIFNDPSAPIRTAKVIAEF